MKRLLVIDNYDSFTYNLVHYLQALDCEVTVLRNDEFDLDEVVAFEKILLSPGPGIPDEAGLLKPLISKYAATKSILGVCLGQQAIGEVFGAKLLNLKKVYHGVATKIRVCALDELLFSGLETTFEVGRYHSWVVSDVDFPEVLEITSVAENGEIMSIRHKKFDVRGVQFHPESILTPHGKQILEHWVNG